MDTDSDSDSGFMYLIVKPKRGSIFNLFKYFVSDDTESRDRFLDGSENGVRGAESDDRRFVIIVSIIARKIISLLRMPAEFIGYMVEFFLNFLSLNGNLLGLLSNVLHGNVVIPERGAENFISMIGHLDQRIGLYRGDRALVKEPSFDSIRLENQALMDICIMASKLAYENAKVVQNVVTHHWKMHFVGFYNCWNDYQNQLATQVFVLCDKPKDANLILISFRGTEPFDADDWGTDVDYSWYNIPGIGKIHIGFLEALGLGNRTQTLTFQNSLLIKPTDNVAGPEMAERTAYYSVRNKLRILLKEHKNAKFVVTGHSLGGALAILFPTVLVIHEETEMMKRMLGVYTFGQPRIGNRELGRFMEPHIYSPDPKYFRVVYCNDVVARLPYDDKTFLYKHFGTCLYYDSFYNEQRMEEEPDPNCFGIRYMIREHVNAVWELMRALTMGYSYGAEYKEGWFSIFFRVLGLAIPGLSAHCPKNYVDAIRLGRERVIQMSSLESPNK